MTAAPCASLDNGYNSLVLHNVVTITDGTMGKGLSDLQRRILVTLGRHRREKSPEPGKPSVRLWLKAPREVYETADRVAEQLLRNSRSYAFNGVPMYKSNLRVTTRAMIDEQVKEMLYGFPTVLEYLNAKRADYKFRLGTAAYDVLKKMKHANGLYLKYGWPCWLFIGETEPLPTDDELAAVIAAAEHGGWWGRYAGETAVFVTYNELLAELFGFPVTGHITATAFDVKAIGEERYNTARASLQRACARLEQRGLVWRRSDSREPTTFSSTYQRAGVALTEHGNEAAAGLMAEGPLSPAPIPSPKVCQNDKR